MSGFGCDTNRTEEGPSGPSQKCRKRPARSKNLKKLLLKMGGEYLVAPQNLIRRRTYLDVSQMWDRAIPTGYALSDDGLWRQHTWGLLRNGVLETTEVRLRYFGIPASQTCGHIRREQCRLSWGTPNVCFGSPYTSLTTPGRPHYGMGAHVLHSQHQGVRITEGAGAFRPLKTS